MAVVARPLLSEDVVFATSHVTTSYGGTGEIQSNKSITWAPLFTLSSVNTFCHLICVLTLYCIVTPTSSQHSDWNTSDRLFLFFIGFFSPTAFWDFCSVFPMWHTKLLIKTRNRKPNNAQARDILTKNIQLWAFQLCNKRYTHFTDTTLHCYITATIHFCFCSYC